MILAGGRHPSMAETFAASPPCTGATTALGGGLLPPAGVAAGGSRLLGLHQPH